MRPLRYALLVSLLAAPTLPAAAQIRLDLAGRFSTGVFDQAAAEIGAYDAATRRLYVVNALAATVTVLDLTDAARPFPVDTLDLRAYGAGVNSVSVSRDGYVAAAVEAAVKQTPGRVVVLSRDGRVVASAEVGALPDALTWTPDGRRIVAACEGEPSDDYATDPEGTVAVLDFAAPATPGGAATLTARLARFVDFNAGGPRAAEVPAGYRIGKPGALLANDAEPEYAAVSADSRTAFVTLQENNALAVVDLASATVSRLVGLGHKDHAAPGNGLDASDQDGPAVNVRPWPVRGLYMPDAVAAVQTAAGTFLLTANEGDAREYAAFKDVARVSTLALDPTAFPDAAIKTAAQLGRLNVVKTMGDADGDGDHDALYSYGARSFSVWDAASGARVWDSGDAFERHVAEALPAFFNANHTSNTSFDTRSDDKGPEPEGLATGVVAGRTYAFVGLERVGGVMTYDVTDPRSPRFVHYVNPRSTDRTLDPKTAAGLAAIGDLGPEGLVFVPAADRADGVPLLIALHEVSGTVAVFRVAETATAADRAPAPAAALGLRVSPNPAPGPVVAAFDLPAGATGTLRLLDALGRTVAAVDGLAGTGAHTFGGLGLAPGAYFVRLDAGERATTVALRIAR